MLSRIGASRVGRRHAGLTLLLVSQGAVMVALSGAARMALLKASKELLAARVAAEEAKETEKRVAAGDVEG